MRRTPASAAAVVAAARGEDAGDQTRYPGFDLEPADGFYKVTHIYRDGPADKDYVKIKVGDYVLAVDGQDLKAGDNYWKNFTLAPGGRFEFTVNSKPAKDGAWTTKITPVSHATVRQPAVRALGR